MGSQKFSGNDDAIFPTNSGVVHLGNPAFVHDLAENRALQNRLEQYTPIQVGTFEVGVCQI